MKRIFYGTTIAAIAALSMLTSCSYELSGVISTITEPISTDYFELEISSAISVEYSETAKEIEITADNNVLPYVLFDIDGGVLDIKLCPCCKFRNPGKIEVVLPASLDLRGITVSGASSFTADNSIIAPDFSIDLSGASYMKAEIVVASEFEIEISGASNAHLCGLAGSLSANVSGASRLSAASSRISSDDMEISVSGASTVYLDCTGTIKGDVSGASKVMYGEKVRSAILDISGASTAQAK